MSPVAAIPVNVLSPVDATSSVARYRQIADRLASHVMDARPGTRLPSEPEIVAHLGVSRATATQALRELERRGLVIRRQGKGTFVADTERAIRTNEARALPSFSEDLHRAGRSTRERVIALEIVAADDEIVAHLGVPLGADVWRAERVIVSDGEPVVHLTSWLPREMYPSLTRSGIGRARSTSSCRTLTARTADRAPPKSSGARPRHRPSPRRCSKWPEPRR